MAARGNSIDRQRQLLPRDGLAELLARCSPCWLPRAILSVAAGPPLAKTSTSAPFPLWQASGSRRLALVHPEWVRAGNANCRGRARQEQYLQQGGGQTLADIRGPELAHGRSTKSTCSPAPTILLLTGEAHERRRAYGRSDGMRVGHSFPAVRNGLLRRRLGHGRRMPTCPFGQSAERALHGHRL
jgi:hypothetical protein